MECHLLRVPLEVRLMIYDLLWTVEDQIGDALQSAEVDLAAIASYDTSPESEQFSVKPYSLLLTHPQIYAEAVPYVLQLSTLVLRRPADVGPTMTSLNYNTEYIRTITFDFGKHCGPKQMSRSIRWISMLPQLVDVTIRIKTRQCMKDNGLRISEGCEFPKLTKATLVNLDERKDWDVRDEYVAAFNQDVEVAREEIWRHGRNTKSVEWKAFPRSKRTRRLAYKSIALQSKSEAIRHENQTLQAKVFQLGRGNYVEITDANGNDSD